MTDDNVCWCLSAYAFHCVLVTACSHLLQVTPVWRAGPYGPKTLCNACGVRYMKQVKKK